jgi:hypothetical protein
MASPAYADVLMIYGNTTHGPCIQSKVVHQSKTGEVRKLLCERELPYSAWPSMIGPNSCHFSPVNFIIWTCSIG